MNFPHLYILHVNFMRENVQIPMWKKNFAREMTSHIFWYLKIKNIKMNIFNEKFRYEFNLTFTLRLRQKILMLCFLD